MIPEETLILLRRFEWCGWDRDGRKCCPACTYYKESGHEHGCVLDSLIKHFVKKNYEDAPPVAHVSLYMDFGVPVYASAGPGTPSMLRDATVDELRKTASKVLPCEKGATAGCFFECEECVAVRRARREVKAHDALFCKDVSYLCRIAGSRPYDISEA